ncbi:LOW QUALITY PROTEIN: membrane progestin receptor beta [Alosa alosa]|uniref:LOW QUALITY PROTEIN: membrane progestin receptor beta n=1 Tax=Alosa alosa TaxID=278164 RepID=UPI00201508FD|nr:LOW QUALITY PROTEIN: membrane progestin receptor beta [Alosa alosa]
MSTVILQRLSTLSLTVKQLGNLPRLSTPSPPSPPPKPTVPAGDVPSLFREPYILSGYRPTGQSWKCYLLSVFQWHNESLNVWTHLLAAPVLLLRCWALLAVTSGDDGGHPLLLDLSVLPLALYVLSSLTYLACSVAAHLLQSHSELAHYSLFFLDYVGVAVYQYGCALGHYFYSAEAAWRNTGGLRTFFLPGAALLAWLSCACCCFAKAHYRRPYPLRRKVCQLIPTSLAYFLDISPVVQRLVTGDWERDAALPFHAGQVAFFLMAAFFFSYPFPECFLPGHCDIVGHAHQVFHLFLSMCTMCQLEALFRDFVARREAILEVHGEELVVEASVSFFILVLCCLATAGWMHRTVHKQLKNK